MRLLRISIGFIALLTCALALQLGGAGAASAATTCKQYDSFTSDSGTRKNVRVCAAPAADFPSYSGWGRFIDVYRASPSPCDYTLLPYDIDDKRSLIACRASFPTPIDNWRWDGRTWVSGTGFTTGQAVYVAPYATGWRWVWTAETGWRAVAEQHVAFRWFA